MPPPHRRRVTWRLEVVETDRSDEMFGEDRRVIDNTRSSASLTRTITFTKEWTRTYEIQTEKAQGSGAEFSLGVKDAAGLKVSSEQKLRNDLQRQPGGEGNLLRAGHV